MAGICTVAQSTASCSHYSITAVIDGVSVSLRIDNNEALAPLTSDELETFVRYAARRIRQGGTALSAFVNRTLIGDEATNVKQYSLLGPGAALTKTNIGASYVNVLPGLNGERILVECTGCTQFRVVVSGLFGGTGAYGMRIVRDSDLAVLYENASISANGSERELDTDWQPLPSSLNALEIVRLQAKSATATDDPVFRRCTLLLK